MVLESNGLFPRTGLEQSTGSIAERWGQDGNVIFNYYDNIHANETIYTVTAGKVLYIKAIFSVNSIATAGQFTLKDTSAGDTIFNGYQEAGIGKAIQVTFDAPLKFETEIYTTFANACQARTTFVGWEEPA